jgi:predicted small secreted protein
MNKILLLSILLGTLPLMAGCETSRGLGDDLENAGEEIEDAAEDTADSID